MPYDKRSRSDQLEISDNDRAFHDSFKPSWGVGNALMYALPERTSKRRRSLRMSQSMRRTDELGSAGRNIHIARFSKATDVSI